jgi:hypothetical protein
VGFFSRSRRMPALLPTAPSRHFTLSELLQLIDIVTYRRDYRRGLDWRIDLLTTYTHDSELQAVTTPPLISTIQNHHNTR